MNEIREWQNHKGKIIDSVEGVDVIDCELCGFAHIIPLPDYQETLNYYSDNFYQSKEDYIKSHTDDLEWRSIEYNEKYDFFDQHIDQHSSKKILDIGSGPGYFLKTGSDRGWNVTGIEPGIPAYEFSKQELGANIINVFFSIQNYKNFGTFDVIHLNNVLEHIIDPRQLLQLSYEILNPSGIICITVPNDFNPLQKIAAMLAKHPHWWVVPKEHVNYFCMESLSKLINFIGFKAVHQTASFPLELFILMGDDYIADKNLGREIHFKRKKFEQAMTVSGESKLKRQMYNKFSELGLGRQITIFGKK